MVIIYYGFEIFEGSISIRGYFKKTIGKAYVSI
jgi:hypothetical protein